MNTAVYLQQKSLRSCTRNKECSIKKIFIMEKVSKTNSVDSKLNGVEVNAEVGG